MRLFPQLQEFPLMSGSIIQDLRPYDVNIMKKQAEFLQNQKDIKNAQELLKNAEFQQKYFNLLENQQKDLLSSNFYEDLEDFDENQIFKISEDLIKKFYEPYHSTQECEQEYQRLVNQLLKIKQNAIKTAKLQQKVNKEKIENKINIQLKNAIQLEKMNLQDEYKYRRQQKQEQDQQSQYIQESIKNEKLRQKQLQNEKIKQKIQYLEDQKHQIQIQSNKEYGNQRQKLINQFQDQIQKLYTKNYQEVEFITEGVEQDIIDRIKIYGDAEQIIKEQNDQRVYQPILK